ncbi:protein yellow [Condylostylus longicornis]|uniref:protein yellow n=1 Tax=Condylostylus longicornis TaxID=2530218 RepID=UPI00244DCA60|nr:protein yellow [Condylostylus longicornis]XP_055371454.1 protein yellow [Condylostylus longicornis]
MNLYKDLLTLLTVFMLFLNNGEAAYKLQERYSWNQLDFAFPNPQLKQQAIQNKDYIPQNALPVGVEHYQNKLFVTVPRWRDGIPATLTYINMDHTVSGSPELIPYPDWRSNTAGDCANSITTAYRIKVDECGRLWVLDTGTLGIGNTTTNPCPYALNIFDLSTNSRIRRYVFRPEDTNANTFIANIAIDIGKNCDDAFAYFSDELGYGLISYSWEQNKSWRFSGHSYFFPDPLRGDYNIAGLNFQWGEEGIFGMALSPLRSDGYRTMYFSPLASHREFAVSTRTLRDESRVEDSYHDFTFFNERGPNSHTTARVMSDEGIMLFNLIDQNAVGCWHSSMPYEPQYHGVVDRDDVGLVFPADVKIDENRDVWVLSDRMPVFLLSDLDYNDVNFRIYTASLNDLIEGTVCDAKVNLYQPKPIYNGYRPRPIGGYQKPQYQKPIYQAPQPVTQKSLLLPAIPQVKEPVNNYLPVSIPASPPVSAYYTTQRVPISHIPKAFIFNQHNGLNYETSSPAISYNPGGGLSDFRGSYRDDSSTNYKNFGFSTVWGNNQ